MSRTDTLVADAAAPPRSARGAAGRRGLPPRALLVLPAAASLLAGLDAALVLLGLPAPVGALRWPDVHGPVLVLGFVGTLVALERAVALGRRTGHGAPALLGAGSLVLLTPLPRELGAAGLVAGALALVGVYLPLWRRQRDEAVLVQALGAVLAAGAAILWLGGVPVAALLPWLAGFVVLTIAGERLELARLALGPGAGTVLVVLAAAFTVGVLASLLWPQVGHPLLGGALLSLVAWLAHRDVARRTLHASGLARFMAACLLAGYAWLAVAGAIWLLGPASGGERYDAVVHAVFLGFTVSMIMAHAPVILPAVLRRPLPWHPAMWLPAALLHTGLVVRLWLGDGLGSREAWQVGGVLNIAAVLLFVLVAAASATIRPRGGSA